MKIKVSGNFYIILATDIVLVMLSFYIAHLIRFDFAIPGWAVQKMFFMLPFVIIVKIGCFYIFDLYRGMWRYTGIKDLLNVVKASIMAALIVIAVILYVNRFEDVSRSVFIIDLGLTLNFIIALRVLTRLVFEQFTENVTVTDLLDVILGMFRLRTRKGRRVLIIGAGDCGEKICREIREDAALKYSVVGFVDDDPAKIGRKIHGVSIISQIENLEDAVAATNAEEAIIAIPSLKVERMRQVVAVCKSADIQFKTVPSMGELINGKVTVNSLRDVEYRDLLGRAPVELEKDKIGHYISGKKILVTGAGGSIGKELCKQIALFAPDRMILFDQAETPLFEIDIELKKEFDNIDILPVLGNIQAKEELEAVFEKSLPDIVFHAAAYKHVPMLEGYPWKAVNNNVVGTENVAAAAIKYHVEKFVLVSTDKAVNPSNVMGATKRVAEMMLQRASLKVDHATKFITVRFGNVIGSGGSVIPIFKNQIKQGGPVTVTHPDMTRFFMLIPEACQLILQAGAMGEGGEIYVLEMGEPVKIDDMAKDLIRFLGFEPGVDIQIEYIGLRPGEKLYEELVAKDEFVVPTTHPKIMVLNSNNIDIELLDRFLAELKNAAQHHLELGAFQGILKKIVPEYTSGEHPSI